MRRLLPILLLLAPLAAAQPLPLTAPFTAPGTTGYASGIPTPEEVVGHRIGARHTTPEQVVRYFEAVAAVSDRVTLGDHGWTHEGRPLVHAIVTQAGRDLAAAEGANRRLSEAPGTVSDAALAALPVVAYMGYSVHGDEASGTEAAILLLYHLAAGEGPAVEEVLRHAVTIIDPMLNPDGRARFTSWVNANRSGSAAFASTDPQDREHNQPWPGGRTNHYLFDLNRDWLPLAHPESQGRMALWHRWRPQLSTDYHEMGGDATYFFQPGIPSRNNPNTPDLNYELTARIAEYHARALDRIGSLYYTRESFDDFYFGKGSTYPDIMGSVGILFEQASSRALAAQTVHGVLEYGATVRNQFATSLSSLEAAVAMRGDLLRFQRDFYAEGPRFARESAVKAYVLDAERYPGRAADLVEMLRQHRVRVYELAAPVEAQGERFQAGRALVVPVDQEQGRFVRATFERVTTFADSLFYDVSTWTVPLAFGLRHAEMTRDARGLLGREITERPAPRGVEGGRAAYAYLLPWGETETAAALYRMQAAGVRPMTMTDPFEAAIGGARRTFARGTVVVPVRQQDAEEETVHRLAAEAAASGAPVVAIGTGLSADGPDLGSRGARVLPMPRVALLAGPGTASYAVGEVWHLLNERAGMPVSLLDLDRLGTADLSRYTTVVMAQRPFQPPGEAALGRLREWVRGGGVLVLTEGATAWAASAGLLDLTVREAVRDTAAVAYADVAAARGAHVIGGSIFEVALDTTHPVAFGFPERLPVFKASAQAFDRSAAPGTSVGAYADAPLLSGYASDASLERISGGAAVVAQRQGRGAVVGFDFNPAFRAYFRGTEGLLLNAIFIGGAF